MSKGFCNTNSKRIALSTLQLIFCLALFPQNIQWNKLPFETVPEISIDNMHLVNETIQPYLYNESSGLEYHVTNSTISEWQRHEWARSTVEEYIREKQIKDEGKKSEKYAVVDHDGSYKLLKVSTETRYYYDEGCGVWKFEAITSIPDLIEEDIICIFNDSVEYPESSFHLFTICSEEGRYIEPNQSIIYGQLEFNYRSTFCEGHFVSEGLQTISPTHFNLTLSVRTSDNVNEQLLLQIPHEWKYRLRNIQIGDINQDGTDDIILNLEDETCQFRALYLSETFNSKTKYRFVGNMEVYCDCP